MTSSHISNRRPPELLTQFLQEHLGKLLPEHIGTRPYKVYSCPYQGFLNYVYTIDSDTKSFILRLKPESKKLPLQQATLIYQKEKWCMEQALMQAVPTSQMVGDVQTVDIPDYGRVALMLLDFLEGINASEVFKRHSWEFQTKKRESLHIAIGQIAKKVNQVHCRGFGSDFEPEDCCFTSSWPKSQCIEYERFGGIDELRTIGSGRYFDTCQNALSIVSSVSKPARLAHADLNLTNLLIEPITLEFKALLDWERATSTIVPEGEIMQVLYQYLWLERTYSPEHLKDILQGTGIPKELDFFLKGYGIPSEQYQAEYRRHSEALLALRMGAYLLWWQVHGENAASEWRERKGLAEVMLTHFSSRLQ